MDRARLALAVLCLLALSGWLAWMPREERFESAPENPAATTLPPLPLALSLPVANVEGEQVEREQDACLVPPSAARGRLSLEPPSFDHWQEATASGQQLAEDPCGNIWALWFNTWAVFPNGDPEQAATFRIVGSEAIGRLRASGVADFVPLGRELWVLGKAGDLARFDRNGWQIIDKPERCPQGQLLGHESTLWLSCSDGQASFIGYWHEISASWRTLQGQPAIASKLRRGNDGGAYVVSADGLRRLLRKPPSDWRAVPVSATESVQVPDVDGHGLSIYRGNGDPLRLLEQTEVSAAVTDNHGLWASVRQQGLLWFDGQHWHRWSFATGLPNEEAHGLLLDRRGRLWLAGSPVAVIEASAAAEQIVQLRMPPPIEGQHFANACDAATAALGRRASSAQVAQAKRPEGLKVFFRGRQVCPDPWNAADADDSLFYRRESDGALLSVGANAQRGATGCGLPCSPERQQRIRLQWQIRQWLPSNHSAAGTFEPQALDLPSPLPRFPPGPLMLLAVNGDAWVATRHNGLFHHNGLQWLHYAEAEQFGVQNPINDLLEDDRGRIWVASQPRWLPEQKRYAGSTVHRFDSGHWTHLVLDGPAPSWSAQALAAIPEGVIVAGNGSTYWIDTQSQARAVDQDPGHFAGFVTSDAARYWWFAHGAREPGVSVRDGARWGRLSSREGLFSNRIRAIAHDSDHRIWMLSEAGDVAVYSRQTLLDRIRWLQ